MRWVLRYDRDGFSVESARKKRRPLPEWYLDEPDEPDEAPLFYVAFRDLATCRPPDGPIPWDKAMAYADRNGFSPEAANVLWNVIRKMDQAERNWHVENVRGQTSGD